MSDELVEQYAAAVRREFRDLPRERRRELAADARSHLSELDIDDFRALAPPTTWAAEYRTGVGLARRGYLERWRAHPVPVRVACIGVLLLTIAGAVVIVWWPRYQPLTGSTVGTQGVVSESVDGPFGSTLQYRDGATFDYLVDIENRGPFAVKLLSRPRSGTVLVPIEVADMTDRCCVHEDAPVVGSAVDVPGHGTRRLSIRFRLAGCEWYERGSGVRYKHLTFDAVVAGVHHELTVPLEDFSTHIEMPGPGTSDCPRGTAPPVTVPPPPTQAPVLRPTTP